MGNTLYKIGTHLDHLLRDLQRDAKRLKGRLSAQFDTALDTELIQTQRYYQKPEILFSKSAKLFRKYRHYDLTHKWLDMILNHDPDNLHALGMQAQCYMAQGDYAAAQGVLARIVQIDP